MRDEGVQWQPRWGGWRVSRDADWLAVQQQPSAGRWHYAGSRLVYASSTPALAVLEALVHHRAGRGPYWLCRLTLPGTASVESVHADELPSRWRGRPSVTRRIGQAWLEASRSVVLIVPSAVCPETANLLVNPALVDEGDGVIERVRRFRFDRRLLDRRR